jgi:glc operon protein GlcG
METLSLERAQKLVTRAMEKAKKDFQRPICVSVCDQWGFLLAFGRMDASPIRSIQIAQRKAFTAVRMGVATDVFFSRLQQGNMEASYFDETFTALPGGNPLKDKAGNMIGGVGVSGLAASEDQAITEAMAALIATGEV